MPTGHKMVTNGQNGKIMISENLYQLCNYQGGLSQNPTKKGFTAFNICKPLFLLVGTNGFEPSTSTVSG